MEREDGVSAKFLIIQAQELRQNEFTKRGFLQSLACEQLKELIWKGRALHTVERDENVVKVLSYRRQVVARIQALRRRLRASFERVLRAHGRSAGATRSRRQN